MITPRAQMSRFETLVYGIGGVVMNILVGGIALGMLTFSAEGWGHVRIVLSAMAWVNLGYAVRNLLPISSGPSESDGSMMINALKGRVEESKDSAGIEWMRKLGAGLRPRDVPTHVSFDSVKPEQVPTQDLGPLYYSALDRGAFVEALTWIRELSGRPESKPILTRLMEPELLFARCVCGDAPAAAERGDRLVRSMTPSSTSHRILAAYEWKVNRDLPAALASCEKGKELLPKTEFKGLIPLETDLLTYLESQIRQELAEGANLPAGTTVVATSTAV